MGQSGNASLESKTPDVEFGGESYDGTKPRRTASSAIFWALPRVCTAAFFVILFLWIYKAEGGLGTHESNLFGLHALLMALFVTVFMQEGILAYASPLLGPFTKNPAILKIFHMTSHFVGLLCAIGGMIAIIYYKRLSVQPVVFPFYTMYSPHSYIGISVLGLWAIQFLAGIYASTKSGSAQTGGFREFHKFLGKFVYGAGLAACAMGFQDMQSSDLAASTAPMTPGMDMSEMNMDMEGYLPTSRLARYASFGSVLLLLVGLATFGTLARRSVR